MLIEVRILVWLPIVYTTVSALFWDLNSYCVIVIMFPVHKNWLNNFCLLFSYLCIISLYVEFKISCIIWINLMGIFLYLSRCTRQSWFQRQFMVQ